MTALRDLSPTPAAIAAQVSDAEYARLLLVPRARLADGLLRERADAARAWYAEHGRPLALARVHAIAAIRADGLLLEADAALPGSALSERMAAAGASGLVALVASAGHEVDEVAARAWAEGRPDDGFFLERFGVAVAEELLRTATVTLCRDAESRGETLTSHLSPGCGGWELAAQAPLWRLLSGDEPARRAVTLHASGSLSPKASLLAAIGISSRADAGARLAPADACRACDLQPCAFRRAPYRVRGAA